jgi:hypothetical protein
MEGLRQLARARGPGTTMRSSKRKMTRLFLTAGTDASGSHVRRSASRSPVGNCSLTARTSTMTSGRRLMICSVLAWTDSVLTSAKTLSPPAAVSMSWRKPMPPLT